MFIRRSLTVLFYGVLLLAILLVAGWWLARVQLKAWGVEQLEVSGVSIAWNRVAFDSLALVWTDDDRMVTVKTLGPALTLDWSDWQLDQLVARSAWIEQMAAAGVGASRPATSSGPSESDHAFRLTLSDSMPFWLPRHLSVNQLQASFPCPGADVPQGTQCRFQGAVTFDRNDSSATAKVDATLARGEHTLSILGDIQLGDNQAIAPGGELVVEGLGPWLASLAGPQWQPLVPHAATLQFAPLDDPASDGRWPMAVSLKTRGGAAAAFDGELVLHTGDDWRLEVRQGRLGASLARWQQAGWVLDDIRAELPFTGEFTGSDSQLRLAPGALVSVRHADPLSTRHLVWLDDLAVAPGGLTVAYRSNQWQVEGPVEVRAGAIRHDSLVTQGWQLKTDVRWTDELILDGQLENDAGAQLTVQARHRPVSGLEGQAGMTLSSENDASHLADTLTAWPGSLTIEEGEADLTARFRWQPETPLIAMASLEFTGASGLFDRMAWQGLSGQVQASLEDEVLTVETTSLALRSLNPGMPLGPITLVGRYRSTLADPTGGELAISVADVGFAGGAFSVAPQRWQLDVRPIKIPVSVQGLQLSSLMELYPTEGLSGEGVLEGWLPVIISEQGIRVEGGELAALPPGGELRLPAQRLQAMASANETMALVARAMEEFHYDQLTAGIDYSEDGILLLDLKLKGTSPRVDSDRPVVLNITLEEDIPALLTSLQLSGRVSDAVTERVQEWSRREEGDNP